MDQVSRGGELRADAQRNRDRVVEAARELFAERGVRVPLTEIAKRAGVGIATLYRRFPTREDLVAASFERKLDDYEDALTRALAAPDAWEGFSEFVWTVCAMQAADAGLADVLVLTFPLSPSLARRRRETHAAFGALVERAQRSGALRDDFVTEDLPVLLMANAGVIHATREVAPDAWRRFAAYMVDSYRAPSRSTLPAPPEPRRLYRALRKTSSKSPR
jgi:AcrR family transcriptional regulator